MSRYHIHLAAQTGLGDLEEVGGIFAAELDLVADLIELRNSNFTGLIVSVGYPNRVNPLVDKVRGLFQHGSCQHYNTGCAITNLLILRPGKLDQ